MSLVKSLASVISPKDTEMLQSAALAEINPADESSTVDLKTIPFQYFPETIQDSRSVEFVTKTPVGSSHPIYQWVGGSPRMISFQAILTADETAPPHVASSSTMDSLSDAAAFLDKIGSIVKNPAAAAMSAIKGDGKTSEQQKFGIDIAAYIAWLRAKTYPLYNTGSTRFAAPPKLILYLPNSGIVGASVAGYGIQDSVYCIMTQCNVTYEAFFRNGTPRIATVDLEFAEILQVGSSWKYVGKADVDKEWTPYIDKIKTRDVSLPLAKQSGGAADTSVASLAKNALGNFVKGFLNG